jgi:hypothetical protein
LVEYDECVVAVACRVGPAEWCRRAVDGLKILAFVDATIAIEVTARISA